MASMSSETCATRCPRPVPSRALGVAPILRLDSVFFDMLLDQFLKTIGTHLSALRILEDRIDELVFRVSRLPMRHCLLICRLIRVQVVLQY